MFFNFKNPFKRYVKESEKSIASEQPNLVEQLIRIKYEKLGPYTYNFKNPYQLN